MNDLPGLTSEEAKKRLASFGANALAEKPPPSALSVLFDQLKSPLVYILFFAFAVTMFLQEYVDGSVILLAVVMNTILGFVQERKAQHDLAALKKILTPQAKVTRDGKTMYVRTSELVPGDVVLLSNGDRIPADGHILESVSLFINESMLTGESLPVGKSADRDNNLVAMGTVVTGGRGTMTVTKTGMVTAMGRIAQTLGETKEEHTPLQRQLSSLARTLAVTVFGLSTLIFIVGVIFGEEIVSMFTTAVAVAVSAIPEGMVVSLTVILAVGMQRILKRKSVVRKLVSAETLGSVTTICIDKTGTLTEGVMRVVESELTDHERAVRTVVLANNLDDPIEIALWNWARGQNHFDPQKMTDDNPRVAEIPFDSTRKYMAVATKTDLWVKGAPEILLEKSDMSDKERKHWTEKITEFGSKGLRVIGIACGGMPSEHEPDITIANLQFLGIIAVSDPIRKEVKETLAVCRKAGISVKVVTGDYRVTSEAVLREIGIPITNPEMEIMEGKELENIRTEDLHKRVREIKLFCRVTPHQKLKIVDALKAVGEVVAMTGDGVNDALALKKADIAIVVEGASDVAKETADIILLDSNLTTIVAAVEEGRGIFQNIRKVVLYLLSDALTEITIIIASLVMRLPLPLTASQILWINILSDGFPNLALAFEPKDRDLMDAPPRPNNEPIIDREIRTLIILIGIVTSVLSLAAFIGRYLVSHDLAHARTLVFAIVGIDSLIYVFSCRSLSKPLLKSGIMRNRWLVWAVFAGFILQILPIYHPGLAAAFDTTPLDVSDWLIVAAMGVILIAVIEGVKYAYLTRHIRRMKTASL